MRLDVQHLPQPTVEQTPVTAIEFARVVGHLVPVERDDLGDVDGGIARQTRDHTRQQEIAGQANRTPDL